MSDMVDVPCDNVRDPEEPSVELLWDRLTSRQFDAALRIAQPLHARGVGHPCVFLAQAIGGLLFDDRASLLLGHALLQAWAKTTADDQHRAFYDLLLRPLMPGLLGPLFYSRDHARVVQLLSIVTAALPSLGPVFDLAAAAAPLDLAALRQRGVARAKLIPAVSRAAAPRRAKRAVIGMRDLVFPGQPNSRPHEIPPRIQASLAAYGWKTAFSAMAWQNLSDEYAAIAVLCEQIDADVLILDDQLVEYPHVRPLRSALLRHLRATRPAMQVVSVYLDPWSVEPDALRAASEAADVIWTMSPAQPLWRESAFADKCLFAPFPYAPAEAPAMPPLRPRMRFSGGVLGYNWHRAFWLSAAALADLPIDLRLAAHTRDGLSASESTDLYMRELTEATCAVNFSMRPDLSRIATGRCFETCLAGSLLIQESTDDLDYYLTSGEHYLEFTSFSELCGIARLLQTQPDEVDEVRRCGRAFAATHYDSDSIAAALDNALASRRRP